jgi:hypothetical protein
MSECSEYVRSVCGETWVYKKSLTYKAIKHIKCFYLFKVLPFLFYIFNGWLHFLQCDIACFRKIFSLYCCAGWGYIVAFTQVQIYHTWIHLLYPSPLSVSYIPGVVSIGIIFFIYIHVYTFLHYIQPLTPFPQHAPNIAPPSQDLFSPPVLWFCRRKKIK